MENDYQTSKTVVIILKFRKLKWDVIDNCIFQLLQLSLESPFDINGGGPDAYGYFWSDNSISNNLDYEWVDISETSTQVTFDSNDGGTSPIEIGFDFPFYGDAYSEFIINANGWIGFENDNLG